MPYDIQTSRARHSAFADRPQLPYLLPFMAFVGCMLPSSFGTIAGINLEQVWFDYLPIVYTVKTIIAALLLAWLWKYFTPIVWRHLGLGVVVGLLGTVLWVGLEYGVQDLWMAITHTQNPLYPRLMGSAAKVYKPFEMIHSDLWRTLFLIVRIGGPTLVVPFMEELFFRDFLMRALIRGARFQEVAVGTFTWTSLIGMSVLFAINHYQWPSGFAYGLLMGVLLIRTKSLGACIVAHGTTNLTLYLWVVYAGTHGHADVWQFM